MPSLLGQLSLFDVDAAGEPQNRSAEPKTPPVRVDVDEAAGREPGAASEAPEADVPRRRPRARPGTDPRASRSPERVSDRELLCTSPVSGSLLSPEDVARRCGLSRKAVYRAVARGELRAARIRSRLRIDPDDLEAWLKANVVQPDPPAPAPAAAGLPVSTGLRRLLPD